MAVKAHTVTEAFTAASTNPPWLVRAAGASFTGGQMRLAPAQGNTTYAGYEYSANRVDLVSSSLLFEVVSAGNQALGSWQCLLGELTNPALTAQVLWVIAANRLRFVVDPPGSPVLDVAYSAVNHRWLRIRATATAYFLDASPDGTTWNQLYTATLASLPMSLADCFLWFEAGTYSSEASATSCLVDNLNLPPAPAASGRPAVWLGAAFTPKPGMVRTAAGTWVEKPWARWTGTEWKVLP